MAFNNRTYKKSEFVSKSDFIDAIKSINNVESVTSF